MAIRHLESGDITSLMPLGAKLAETPTRALFKDEHLEVMHVVLPAGRYVPAHAVDGPITIQCLEGQVEIGLGDKRKGMHAGELLYLAGGVTHDITAASDAALLVSMALLNERGVPGAAIARRKHHDDTVKT